MLAVRGLHGKVSNMSVMRTAVLLFSPDLCEESIEGFIEDQASSPSHDLAPRTPPSQPMSLTGNTLKDSKRDRSC